MGYAGEGGRQRQGSWRVTQHTAKTQRAGDPPTDMSLPRAEAAAHAGAVGAEAQPVSNALCPGGDAPEDKQGVRIAADVAPKPASQLKVKPKVEFPNSQGGTKKPGPKGTAKSGANVKGKGRVGEVKKKKLDIAAGIKISACIIACLTTLLLVGEIIKAIFHLHKDQTVLVTMALYPIFIILFIWLFVRTIFKPVADAGTKATPLPPETSDPGTRDDGSLLM